jgi:hypothetical protein
LVLQDDGSLLRVIQHLYEQGTLLPVVIFPKNQKKTLIALPLKPKLHYADKPHSPPEEVNHLFHAAEVRLGTTQLAEIAGFIDKAKSLSLYPSRLPLAYGSIGQH